MLLQACDQRLYAIACGYPDGNDAGRLGADPIQKLLCGRDPLKGEDLASQPTLSRFENACDRATPPAPEEQGQGSPCGPGRNRRCASGAPHSSAAARNFFRSESVRYSRLPAVLNSSRDMCSL